MPSIDRDVAAYLTEGQRLVDKYENSNNTSAANLPRGQVTYRGIGIVDTDPDGLSNRPKGAIGRSRVDADFDKNTLEAKVDRFVDVRSGDDVEGSLDIRDGRLRNGSIVGAVDGSIDGGRIVGLGEGAITGSRGQAVAIVGDGNISGGRYEGAFEGAIIGER